MINIGLIGASGRMGSEIISQILLHDNLNLSVACVTDSDKFLNCPVKTQILTFINDTLNFTSSIENVFQNSDLIIDFSSPIALNEALNINCKYKKPFFSGTTPMNEEIKNKINELSRVAKICHASNTSLGINLIKKICENLGYVLKDYDCEILEKHHSKKKDAPSGTSLSLGNIINQIIQNKSEISVIKQKNGAIKYTFRVRIFDYWTLYLDKFLFLDCGYDGFGFYPLFR